MLKLVAYLLMVPQAELPYLDALPLDYPQRCSVIGEWNGRAQFCGGRESGLIGCSDYWTYREGTRLYLLSLLAEGRDADDVRYLLGRMQGRHYLWQPVYQNGQFSCCWIDTLR